MLRPSNSNKLSFYPPDRGRLSYSKKNCLCVNQIQLTVDS